MSKAKYSPSLFDFPDRDRSAYSFNAKGETPQEIVDVYNDETMSNECDDEGFDSYGYSSYDVGGNFVGIGQGIDRWGYTEADYDIMDEDEFFYVANVEKH